MRPRRSTTITASGAVSNNDSNKQVFYVTGEADFILVVTAPDTETYDALMSRMLEENTNVKRFTTNVVMSVVKQGLDIPVPRDIEA